MLVIVEVLLYVLWFWWVLGLVLWLLCLSWLWLFVFWYSLDFLVSVVDELLFFCSDWICFILGWNFDDGCSILFLIIGSWWLLKSVCLYCCVIFWLFSVCVCLISLLFEYDVCSGFLNWVCIFWWFCLDSCEFFLLWWLSVFVMDGIWMYMCIDCCWNVCWDSGEFIRYYWICLWFLEWLMNVLVDLCGDGMWC